MADSIANEKTKIYYVDGYHGGLKGHMPFGCWTDILHVFHQQQEWKLSIEVEPISWDYLKIKDPAIYASLRDDFFAAKNQDRVEIVAGSYAQPYCWNIGGESNIRQLIRGIRLSKAHFPDAIIDTYAVQEPCWTSSLPQILLSLGFKRSTLKNPGTAWAGYSSGFNQELVNWVGPDGSAIPCVPRYACEEITNAWNTECERMEADFVEKCLANGITRPVGSQFQDLGWPAGPNLGSGYATYVTWREYFAAIDSPPAVDWHFSQEDILCTLPWGEKRLQRLARQVRSAENKISAAEKLATLAAMLTRAEYPAGKLAEAWDNLMLAQHHDAWICVPSREDRLNWGWVAGAQTWLVEEHCEAIIDQSLQVMNGSPADDQTAGCWIKVYNTLGFSRRETISLEVPMQENCSSLILRDAASNPLPCQISVLRISDDGMINAVALVFEAQVPAMGCNTYAIEYIAGGGQAAALPVDPVRAEFTGDSLLVLNTDIYEIVIDLKRGGILTRLFHKPLNQDFSLPGQTDYFNEFRGYFARLGRELSSADYPATAEIIENGPLKLVVAIKGAIADNQLSSTITLAAGQELIDFKIRADFNGEQWIGDPCEVAAENQESERVRSHHDSFKNLHAIFPAMSGQRRVYKNAAFDVCKSRHEDTHFTSWDSIKHNMVLNWLDILDEETATGLAIFADHTTSYGHAPGKPVHLTFAWSGDGGFWWGKCPLSGHQEMRYALLPHRGDWEQSLVSRSSAAWNEPLLSRLSLAAPASPPVSCFSVSDDHVEMPAVYMEDGQVFLRLFHASSGQRQFVLTIGFRPARIAMLELDGRLISVHEPQLNADGSCDLALEMPPFGIRTLAFDLPS